LFWGGIGLLSLALLSSINLVQLRVLGVEASGQVVSQEIREESIERFEDGREYDEDIESYYAVVSFTTGKGTFTITSWDSGTNTALYPTGSQVTVVYPPGQPEKARLQPEISGFRGLFGPLMLVVFGGALIGTSWLLKRFK
jgi:hypothetical protein